MECHRIREVICLSIVDVYRTVDCGEDNVVQNIASIVRSVSVVIVFVVVVIIIVNVYNIVIVIDISFCCCTCCCHCCKKFILLL